MSELLNTDFINPELSPVADGSETTVFYNTKKVAQMLGCSIPTARQLFYRNDFPALKIGKNYKVEKTLLKSGAAKGGFNMKKNINKIVYDILVNDKQSRCNDMYLTARVIEAVCDLKPHTKLLIEQLEQWHIDGLPNINTIIRARRKLQDEHPELIDKKTAEARRKQEERFKSEYGKNKETTA